MFFNKKKKTIVLYYSQSLGNTKNIAEHIADLKSYDIEAIDTKNPYTGSYDEIMEQGKEEVERGYKPIIKPFTHDILSYDKIILGSPTWWYTIAPAVASFLDEYNLSGKIVVPFVTFGGYEGHSLSDLKEGCKKAKILNAKSIQFDSENLNKMAISQEELDCWIQSI